MARWTSDFDCGYETNWWYIIKDEPFDINVLKAKRRYEINKGKKNFDVRLIENPSLYKEMFYNVQVAAFSAYPKKYRPHVDKEKFLEGVLKWSRFTVIAAFSKENSVMAGYALLFEASEKNVDFAVLKTDPEFEKFSVNAAIVEKVLDHYHAFLNTGGVISDGSRCISHETKFQDYLEKYFGFRKAYCHLHIKYNPKIEWAIKMLFPLRRVLTRFDNVNVIHKINGVLKMEEIYRTQQIYFGSS